MFIDLSWVVYPDYIKPDQKAWVDLIERYPNNFMIGSDQVGSFQTYPATVRDYDSLLSTLSAETADKVGRSNLLTVFEDAKSTIPKGYRYPEGKYSTIQVPTE